MNICSIKLYNNNAKMQEYNDKESNDKETTICWWVQEINAKSVRWYIICM